MGVKQWTFIIIINNNNNNDNNNNNNDKKIHVQNMSNASELKQSVID